VEPAMNMIKVAINYSPGGTEADLSTDNGENVKHMTLKLTLEELKLLASLASDQLFRRQFIDPKMPGHRANSGELSLGKALVARLRLILDEGAPKKAPSPTG
jgi:hypothetical protein